MRARIGNVLENLRASLWFVPTLCVLGAVVLSTVLVGIFGQTPADLGQLSTVCFFAGFFTNAGIVGLYAIFAHAYPTHVRATGTGFAIGVGRGGSVLAPAVAGFLFAAGYGVPSISIVMALGSSVAAGVLLFLKLKPDTRDEQPVEEGASMPANLSRAT